MKEIQNTFKNLYERIDEFNSNKFDSRNAFICVLKAAFAKSLEFNHHLHTDATKEEGFFYTPILRGICEEIIVLKFIQEHVKEKRNKIIRLLVGLETVKDIEAQDNFFSVNRPYQPVVRYKNYNQKNYFKNEIKSIINSKGINGDRLPPTKQMAQKVGLIELYNFLYRASSNFVHFNPAILLRFGWKKDKDIKYTYSTKNFHNYYYFFSKIYGAYLFVLFTKTFKKQLKIKGDFWRQIKVIEKSLDNMLTWYEIVTFEELNLKRPSEIFTVLNKVALKYKKEDDR